MLPGLEYYITTDGELIQAWDFWTFIHEIPVPEPHYWGEFAYGLWVYDLAYK